MAVLEPGTMAPHFALNRLENETPARVTFDRLTLLVFFKVTCPTCQLGVPCLDKLKLYDSAEFEAVAIAEDPPEAIHDFQRKFGVSMETLTEPPPYETSEAYGLTNVPTVLLIERGGTIAQAIVGFNRQAYNDLSRSIAERVGAAPVLLCPADDGAPAFKPG
ncbi:MAG TPA: TlpA disulfide reductase family protein [Armatimonadota bacterium]|jgi:peroxiredoxin